MTFEQIKSFLAIVKYNHFTLASQELYISQSSISKHIKSLEKELGVELFNRQHRSVRLTEAGEEFYKFASKSMTNYNNILLDMKKYSCEESSSISIGVIDTMVEYGFASLIGDFQKQYPNIQVDIIERSNSKIIEYLSDSIVNLGFINSHYVFLNTWGNLNYFPNTLYIDSQTKTLLALVSENIGITLLPHNVASSYQKNIDNSIHISSLKNPFSANIFLAQLKNKKLSKNETLFKNFAINWFQKNSIKNV